MAGSTGSVRHRGGQVPKKAQTQPNGNETPSSDVIPVVKKPKIEENQGSEWDFRLALGVLTLLAFATRFYGINHPDQVVFDEVHFGKVGLY